MNQTLSAPRHENTQPALTAPGALAVAPEMNERLSHLFRASLKVGRIHPLYLPILNYRHSRRGE